MESVRCPKCKGPPQVKHELPFSIMYVCYSSCGFVFWVLKVCPHCKDPQKTIFLKRPDVGSIVKCQGCNHKMVYFRCPSEDCRTLFYKNNENQIMGNAINCQQCNLIYKQVLCTCGNQIYFSPQHSIFQGFTQIQCQCCSKQYTFTVCPNPICHQPDYHIDRLQIGDRIQCKACKNWRRYVPCPKCGNCLQAQKFNFCQPITCYSCTYTFQYSKCPYGCCEVNFNEVNSPNQQISPHRQCYICHQMYFVIKCKKCQNTLYQQGIIKGQGVIDSCPHCKDILKYYLCPCGLFNNKDALCLRSTCPKPKMITDNIKNRQEEKNKKEKKKMPETANETNKQCKICFNGVAQYINDQCAHILMCQTCCKSVCKMSDRGSCPVCKTIGKYSKYKEPIYS